MAGLDMAKPADRLEAAVADLQKFREEWAALGSPATAEGSMRSLVAHPYVKLIRDAERAVVALSAAPAVKNKGGRPSGSASAPDRAPQPGRAKLRIA